MCLFPHSFAVEGIVNFWNLGVPYLKFCFHCHFPSQTENIQVILPLEDRLVGRVGFKSYENYFTAGAHWFIIIFLILVNIAAQVNKNIYFGLCPLLGIYILFILYLSNLLILSCLICILQHLFLRTGSWGCGPSLVKVKSERQACRLEPQAGADPDVLRQNFFLLQEASGFAHQAFDWLDEATTILRVISSTSVLRMMWTTSTEYLHSHI